MESLLTAVLHILELYEKLKSSNLLIFHFEIFGIDKSELHPLKILFILILNLNFHLEISGIKDNNEQFSKILFKLYTFLIC